ncbi:MAG: C1 family peptidase [Bacteroidia bacterium]|nr:C1 family peptidase [Bacteroidia bacterium]
MKNIVLLALMLGVSSLMAQEETRKNTLDGPYEFTIEHEVAATPVKSQGRTGTCWSFSTTSFLESELIRKGNDPMDLSEMFVVRNIYREKAALYVRMQGKGQFSPGGTFHDVMNVMEKYGMVPEKVYSGRRKDSEAHNHGEMDAVLEGMLKALVKRRTLTDKWKPAVEAVLDTYLGTLPETITKGDVMYTPKTFAEDFGIKKEDYIELSSFTHHPYYDKFVLEIPDNWDWNQVYNLPLDELMAVMNNALVNGYSVAWDGDVSEKGFMHGKSIAIVPKDPNAKLGAEVLEEMEITPEIRQEAFDNYKTTDDHLMHITGMAKDESGKLFYLTKNSWGDKSNFCGGYLYMSEAYARYKTVHIMVHKDAIPSQIAEKLGLK